MKNVAKKLSLVLAVSLLLTMFGGCEQLMEMLDPAKKAEVVTLPTETEEILSVTLEGKVDCYEEPDPGARILATFNDGMTVTYQESEFVDGVEWVQTEYGWVPLSAVEPPVELREGFITARLLNVRSGPGVDYEKVDQAPKGTCVHVGETAEASDGPWGKTELGWVSLDHVYFPGEIGKNIGHAVVRESGAKVRSAVLESGTVVATLGVAERVQVKERLDMEDGTYWVYAEGGWISSKEIYMEGMEGKRPTTGYVDDTTPLNVRVAPGTENKVNTTLADGTYVEILEQIEYKGHDWGFEGRGWIFMDNVEYGYWD